MTDITTIYDPEAIHCDWKIQQGDLAIGSDLQTAILISLFTDALANADDPIEGSDRRGWWGDMGSSYHIGSKFWLLRREKLSTQVAVRAEQYAGQALRWMVDDGVVKTIVINASIRLPDRLYLKIAYERPDKDSKEMLKFYWVWSENAV